MKKLIILSVAILLVASCGKGGYSPLSRINNNNSQAATPAAGDPAAAFNTIWISDGVPSSTDQEKRGLANFFGYNTAHYANVLDNCYYGFNDETSTTHYTGASCFGPNDFLRNYFNPTSYFILPFPAPKDLGSVSTYSVRFATNVDPATREIQPGSAYLQVTIYSTSETLSKQFTTMKAPMTVVSCGIDCDIITASFKDGCGSAILHAVSNPSSSGTLSAVDISFKQDKASYKKGTCYAGGHLPNGVAVNNDLNTMVDALPGGIATSPTDLGNGELFINGINDLIEQ